MKRKSLLVLAALIGAPAYYVVWYFFLSSWQAIFQTAWRLIHV